MLLIVLSGSYATNSIHVPTASTIQSKVSAPILPSSATPKPSFRASRSVTEHFRPRTSSSASSGQGPLSYNDGPVMHNPTAYAIFWLPLGYHFESGTSGNDSNYESLVTRFLGDLSGSSYLSITTQYPDNTFGSPSDAFRFGGSWIDTTAYTGNGSNLSDVDLTNEIMHAITANNWPEGTNKVYFLFTAENVLSQSLEEAGLCADHTYFADPDTGENVMWANIPDIPQAGCELSGPTPNFDQFADSAINLMSHELFESITDPLFSAWIDSSGSEIGDKCAWTFGPQIGNNSTEPNANIELNGHYYKVQQEWSNALTGCTLSGPSTFSDTITLASYKGSVLPGDYFPITYIIGGQLFVFHDAGGTLTIVTDPSSNVTIGGMSSLSSYGSGEVWCFDSSCDSYSFTSDTNKIDLEYYSLVEEGVSYWVSDGSVLTHSPSLTFLTASQKIGVYGPSQAPPVTLSTILQEIWVLRGSVVSISPSIAGSIGERWQAQEANYTVSSSYSIPTIEFYHQYEVTFNSKIVGGGIGFTQPSITYTSLGSLSTTNNGSKVWVDEGTAYHYPQTLAGSGSSEQWITNDPLSNKISSSEVILLTYLNQYHVTLNVSPGGSASLSGAGGWYNASTSISLLASPSPGWVFQAWSGSGPGSYSGSNSVAVIVVNGPIIEEALFVKPGASTSSSSTSTSAGASESTVTVSSSSSTASPSTGVSFPPPSNSSNNTLYFEIIALILTIAVAGFGYFFLRRRRAM